MWKYIHGNNRELLMRNCAEGNILKEAGTAIREHSVYEYAGIIPGNSIERNARLFIGLALWIVKPCEFDFVFELGA